MAKDTYTDINLHKNKIIDGKCTDPVEAEDIVNKKYVDDIIAQLVNPVPPSAFIEGTVQLLDAKNYLTSSVGNVSLLTTSGYEYPDTSPYRPHLCNNMFIRTKVNFNDRQSSISNPGQNIRLVIRYTDGSNSQKVTYTPIILHSSNPLYTTAPDEATFFVSTLSMNWTTGSFAGALPTGQQYVTLDLTDPKFTFNLEYDFELTNNYPASTIVKDITSELFIKTGKGLAKDSFMMAGNLTGHINLYNETLEQQLKSINGTLTITGDFPTQFGATEDVLTWDLPQHITDTSVDKQLYQGQGISGSTGGMNYMMTVTFGSQKKSSYSKYESYWKGNTAGNYFWYSDNITTNASATPVTFTWVVNGVSLTCTLAVMWLGHFSKNATNASGYSWPATAFVRLMY
jgi:hypothetical protein